MTRYILTHPPLSWLIRVWCFMTKGYLPELRAQLYEDKIAALKQENQLLRAQRDESRWCVRNMSRKHVVEIQGDFKNEVTHERS